MEIGIKFPESELTPLAISIETLQAFVLLIFSTIFIKLFEKFLLSPIPKILSIIIEYLFKFKSSNF